MPAPHVEEAQQMDKYDHQMGRVPVVVRLRFDASTQIRQRGKGGVIVARAHNDNLRRPFLSSPLTSTFGID